MEIINLDHMSANPLLPEVQDAMIEAIKMNYGNPSSQHKIGDQQRCYEAPYDFWPFGK